MYTEILKSRFMIMENHLKFKYRTIIEMTRETVILMRDSNFVFGHKRELTYTVDIYRYSVGTL